MNKKERIVEKDINVIALVKGKEKYVFLYSDDNRTEVLRTLGRYASDPDLSFSWYDAAVLSQKIRRRNQLDGLSIQQRRAEISCRAKADH